MKDSITMKFMSLVLKALAMLIMGQVYQGEGGPVRQAKLAFAEELYIAAEDIKEGRLT